MAPLHAFLNSPPQHCVHYTVTFTKPSAPLSHSWQPKTSQSDHNTLRAMTRTFFWQRQRQSSSSIIQISSVSPATRPSYPMSGIPTLMVDGTLSYITITSSSSIASLTLALPR
ncbi:hypothetical protein D6C81_10706 [Aureobasidium pullulans]|nr:hypothetical protein D6C81_10706 [Aureobasidium pullulans]